MKLALVLPALALSLALAGCGQRERVDSASGGAALMRNLLRAGTVEVAVRAGPAAQSVSRALLAHGSRAQGCALRLSKADPQLPRIVLGCYDDVPVRALVERMGVRTGMKDGQAFFGIAELEFATGDDALVACFEDPEREGLPLTVYYANDEEHLGRMATHELAPGWRPSLRAWSGGREALAGPLGLDGHIEPARLARASARKAEGEPALEPLPERGDGLRGFAQQGTDPERLSATLERIVRARGELLAWAAPGAAAPELDLVAYTRAEDYTRVAGSREAASVDPLARVVHVCLAKGMPSSGGEAAARAAGRKLLGECALPWLEDGAALSAAGNWWGESLESWLEWISARGLALPLERVVDPRADEELSPHLLVPLRAALFRLLRETRGDEALRALWTGKQTFEPDAALAQAFEKSLAARAAAAPAELARRQRVSFPALGADSRQAWRGVESERGLQGEGWASAAGARSVELAHELGANAFGVCTTIVAWPEPLALPDPLHPRRWNTREGDLEVWAALATARGLGMARLVDLDVRASPSGIEDAAWLRVSAVQWERFFATRRAALVHAGLLAELARAEALSLGCGIAAVTRDQVEGRQGTQANLDSKRAGWDKTLAATRAAFSGALVYVATPPDLEQALFWKDLDAVGYQLDAKLAPGVGNTSADRQELVVRMRVALEQAAALASAQKKPWFLARTSFEPTLAAPGTPRSGAGAADPAGQRLQIEALGSALLKLPPASRPSASFLWRWPSDPDEHPIDPLDVLLLRTETLETLRKLWRVL
ncbi:MAG: hypothetical protein IPJ19_09600 [Planctomycetes bacterium]|nr:hypothetical protein [Planctomycetota bacterium]